VIDPDAVRFGADGLVPAIVRDAADGEVLMLAWMDREALDTTLATGEVHFHSRSRDALWKKGETSGNTLSVRAIAADCDADALLVTADPAGPTCPHPASFAGASVSKIGRSRSTASLGPPIMRL